MEFLQSSELCHADRLSRLFPQNSEPLEDTVIASLQEEIEIKNTVPELPVTLEEIKNKVLNDNFIVEMKKI